MGDRPVLARYEVLGKLASGGMGDVWLARASGPGGFHKRVVLKTIRPSGATPEAATQMFLREARVAALIDHPNCVQVFELGEEHGTYFIAMEYIDGFSLARVVRRADQRREPIPVAIVARIAMDAAAGLDHAHALKDDAGQPLGLVHRDVSLENVLVTFGGQTKVVDFGVAKATAGLATGELTESGQIKGKYAYMAPEYLRGEPIDARADVFALGVVLYRTLTGTKPFAGDTDAQVIASILQSEPAAPRVTRPDVPELLATVVAKALAKKPAERFDSARALRAAIAAAVPDAANSDGVAAYMASLWREDDRERVAVRELAAGNARDSKPALTPVPGSLTAPPRDEVATALLRDGPVAATVAEATGSIPTTLAGQATRTMRRRRVALAAGLGLAALAGGAALLFGRTQGERTAHETRDAAAPAVAAAPRTAPKAMRVLIADFDNKTGEEIFDGSLEPAFGVALEEATFLNTFNRGSAKKIAAKIKPDAPFDADMARLVASRESIPIVIAGRIEPNAGAYRVSVTALEGISGNVVFHGESPAAKKSDVLQAVPGLAARIRTALGDTTPESVQIAAADSITTSSLEAAHEYGLAQKSLWAGKYDDAEKLYQRAVAIDPDMSRAYAGLAVVAYNSDRREDADRYFKLALSKIDRMSEHERLKARGTYYVTSGKLDEAIEELGAIAKKYPADSSSITNLSVAYTLKRDFTHAIDYARQALALAPNEINRANLGEDLVFSGDFEQGVQYLEQVLHDNPKFALGYTGIALAMLAQERVTDATATWQRAEPVGGLATVRASLGFADIAMYEGRTADAIQLLGKSTEADLAASNPDAAATKLARLAHAYVLAGKAPAARKALDKALAHSHDSTIAFWAARTYVELGDDAHASALAKRFAEESQTESRVSAELIAGELELAHKKPQAAIHHFQATLPIADTWLAHFDLLQAFVAAGMFQEAKAEAETCLKRRGEAVCALVNDVPTGYLLPPVYYYSGRALEGLGSRDAAEAYKHFLAIKADRIDPLSADARKRLAKLQH
jgi:tetratricopeptide (TPR) repeat protein